MSGHANGPANESAGRLATTLAAGCLLLAGVAGVAGADCPGVELVIPAGTADGFALPTEGVQQSPAYAHFLDTYWVGQGPRVFDQVGGDLALGHSFTGWTGAVCGATLEFRVLAGPYYAQDNDSFRLGYTGSTTPADAFTYWCTLRFLNGTGSWPVGTDATFTVDLADLPPYSYFGTNVISELQDGELEFMVEDDTAVDYATLRVCLCPVGVDAETWGRVKAGYR